jgi:hypothetical protein
MDRAIGLDVEGQFLIVGLLLDTVVVDSILDILYRGVDRVDGDNTDWVTRFFVLIRRDLAAALLNHKLDVELGGGLHVANLDIRVENLETLEILVEVTGLEDTLVFHFEANLLRVDILDLTTETYLFKVEDYVCHILDHTG